MQRLNIARKGIANAEGKVHPSHFSRSKVDRHHIRTKLGIRPIPWPVESFIEKPEKHPNKADHDLKLKSTRIRRYPFSSEGQEPN
jgi:hypothetical protein